MQLHATVPYDVVKCGMANSDGEIDENVEKKRRLPQYEKFVILAMEASIDGGRTRCHNIMFPKIDIL